MEKWALLIQQEFLQEVWKCEPVPTYIEEAHFIIYIWKLKII